MRPSLVVLFTLLSACSGGEPTVVEPEPAPGEPTTTEPAPVEPAAEPAPVAVEPAPAASSSAAPAPGAPAPVEIGEADSGKEIALKVGQELILRLEANPTTGYTWNIVPTEPALLIPAEATYSADPQPAGHVGGGGTAYFRFQATTAGTQTLALEMRRSFEPPETPAAKAVSYTVVVK